MTQAVDASVWLALFWPDDPHHAASRAWMEEQVTAGERLLIPAIALAEVAAPIRRRTGDPGLAIEAVRAILDLPGVTAISVTEDMGRLSGEIAASMGMKGGDAVYAALAFMEHVPLVSWGSEQIGRCPSQVTARRPE